MEGRRASAFQILEKKSFLFRKENNFFDLSDVIVLAPSWCDEFLEKPKRNTQEGLLLIIPFIWDSKNLFDVVAEARDFFSFECILSIVVRNIVNFYVLLQRVRKYF